MKNTDFKKIISGIVMLAISIFTAFGSTYIYDLVEGHRGRELVVIVWGMLIAACMLIASIFLIVKGIDKDI